VIVLEEKKKKKIAKTENGKTKNEKNKINC